MSLYRVFEYFLLICILSLSWFIVLKVESYELGNFTDPIASLYVYSGWISIIFIALSLVVYKKIKRLCGLFGFIFSVVHIGVFVIIDFNFDFTLIYKELLDKYYIYFGILGFISLLLCALFFGKFKFIYYCVYIALLCSILHVIFIQKIMTVNYIFSCFLLLSLGAYKLYCSMK